MAHGKWTKGKSEMIKDMNPELWYELERVRSGWYEFSRREVLQLTNEHMLRLDALAMLGFVEWWEPDNGNRRFYRITEKGVKVLDKRPGAKKPYQPAEPPAPPSEAFLG
jgi:DNA-binding PadR family transcriptional regulator